jgi:hypothetical protein
MPNKTKEQELIERYQNMAKALNNNEKVAKEDRITVKEALTTADANIMIPKTIELVMLDAAEPEYLASQFLRNVNLNEGRSMEFINFGAIRAFEVGEGQEYPEQTLDMARFGGASTEVKVKKYGLKVKITDEMIEDSQWDVIGMHLEAAGRAMARKKEENIFNEFSKHGHVVFDADNGGTWTDEDADGTDDTYTPNATGLAPTGRGFDGTYNGTLSAQDFIDMCTSIMASGFTPTDVIMHPLCYSLFAANDALMGLMGVGAFGGNDVNKQIDLNTPESGSYRLPVKGLQLSFSPYVPFDEVNKKFDFYVIDRNNVGVLLTKDTMSTEQFDDPARDIQALKVKERYGIGILNGGTGIAVAKNIRFAKTWPVPERQFAAMPQPGDMTNANMDEV